MISEFRKTKLLYIFYTFFDVDSSGEINRKDFDVTLENIAKSRKWNPSDAKYKEVQEALLQIWESIQTAADANKDGKVTIEEWLEMWERFAKDPSKPFEWQDLYCKFIFNLQDSSADGSIDLEEFTSVFTSFGLLEDDSRAAFQKMSGGKSNVTWEQFQNLWTQYFTSENPSDPGNFIFGAATY